MHPNISLPDTTMTTTGASIYTNPTALFGVEGQVAVVTGGGTGIGLMMATALESNGATVYIIGRRLEVIEKAAKENNKFGNIIPLQGDITCRKSLTKLVETVRARHGYIDLLVNNAGIARNLLPTRLPTPLDDPASDTPSIKAFQNVLWDTGSPSGFAETFETNVTAAYFTTVAFLELLHLGNLRRGNLPPVMSLRPPVIGKEPCDSDVSKDRDSVSSTPSATYHSLPPTPPSPLAPLPTLSCADSSTLVPPTLPTPSANAAPVICLPQPTSQVITISSSGAFRIDARVLSVSYTMAKSATTHLGRLLANLLADWGIRSNVLCPGVFPSEMTSTQHLTPAILAQAVPLGRAGGLSDISGPILFLAGPAGAYVNGAIWLVDGGRVGSVASFYS